MDTTEFAIVIYLLENKDFYFDIARNKGMRISLLYRSLLNSGSIFAPISNGAGQGAGRVIFADELPRDNVAGHTEALRGHPLRRLVSRVVNHDAKVSSTF